MNRDEKKALVVELSAAFAKYSLVVVTAPKGLTVAETEELRKAARKANVAFKVAKNRLARLALDGSEFKRLEPLMKGPTALASGSDPVAVAKVVAEFAAKNDKLAILGAVMDGRLLTADAVKSLATLPSLDELRGRLVGLLQAPATRLVTVLNAPAEQLVRVFSAYGKKAA